MADDPSELIVRDAAAWRRWLGKHHDTSEGVWLVLAKGGTSTPTRLTHDDALDEALCHGWIDGQTGRRDEFTFRQRFTPRRQRSPWSERNVAIVERLRSEGRMHTAGEAEVERARADGRWAAAYAGQATMAVPDDLAEALRAEPRAQAMFEILSSQNRYSVLFRVQSAKLPATRARRIAQFVDMLRCGETVYPQRRTLPDEGQTTR